MNENSITLWKQRRRKNAIKVLRYDRNGFVLANKKLLQDMKFQWPKCEQEEVADAFVYLASDASSYVTGEILSVDGSGRS